MPLLLVVGPPAAGKSTWVRANAKPGDVTIDFDALACTLTPPGDDPHLHPEHIKAITKAARQAAIDTALRYTADQTVYVIHSTPSAALMRKYQEHGARIVTIDPGYDVVMARAKAERPWWMQQAVKKWYETHSTDGVPVGEDLDDDGDDDHPGLEHVVDRLDADGRPRSRRYKKRRAEFRDACEKDQLPCWLPWCGKPIDYSLRSPHPDSWSLDHAIPVSERPDLAEDPANFRPAHLTCNKQRGTTDVEAGARLSDIGEASEDW